MPIESHTDTLALQRALRELTAFSTIPAMWVGREPSTIAAGLADVLVGSLDLEFAFVRLCDPKGGEAIELSRGHAWKAFPEWLRTHLGVVGQFSCKEIVTDLGGAEPCRGVAIPIGVNAEGGLVAAACTRTDFPSEIDQLLLSVAANHAAAAFQNGRLRHELAEKVAELRQARDELEMKVAERTAELLTSEAYLAEAQRLTHTGSWAWSPVTRETLYWSEEMFRIFGLDPQQGLPPTDTFWERVHLEDRDSTYELMRKAVHEKTEYVHDHRIVLPDATVKQIHAIGHPLLDGAGEVVEYVGTSMDVTERKRADEERERLRQMEADLTHMNRVSMMGELAASLAHEIKQPIAAAVSNADACLLWLARDQPDLGEMHEAATEMVKEAKRAAEIMTRIRSLFKKEEIKREVLDFNEIVTDTVSLLREEADRRSISVRAELDAELPRVSADRVQLQQVLTNLVVNGLEAMKGTIGELTIRSQRDEEGRVLISVSDAGVGLPVGESDKIFDAFFTTKPQGTGMGLAISPSIVESHVAVCGQQPTRGGARRFISLCRARPRWKCRHRNVIPGVNRGRVAMTRQAGR